MHFNQNQEAIKFVFPLLLIIIVCANQSRCSDDYQQCTSGFKISVLRTEFDTADIAGKLLFYFALSDLNVFGFDWAGACDIASNISDVPTLTLYADSFPCIDTSLEIKMLHLLSYLTTLVRLS